VSTQNRGKEGTAIISNEMEHLIISCSSDNGRNFKVKNWTKGPKALKCPVCGKTYFFSLSHYDWMLKNGLAYAREIQKAENFIGF
jgi:hypothetical protein